MQDFLFARTLVAKSTTTPPHPSPPPALQKSIAPLPVKGVNKATTANLTQPNYNQAIAAQLLPRQWPAIVRENGYLKDLKSFL